MSAIGQAGSRIRDRRIEMGQRQAELAKSVGISASYLNLIEHNRRRIAGKLLTDIAAQLGVAAESLSQGVDASLLGQLRDASAASGVPAEMDKVQEFASRYPGWAALVARQSDQATAMQSQIKVLNDRLTYDPSLAHALHELISSVTSIRSSASILVSGEQLDADWQKRFHNNLYQDALRLAQTSEALIGYLEAPKTAASEVATAAQELDAWLAQAGYHIAGLEQGTQTIADVAALANMTTDRGGDLLMAHLRAYVADAHALPYEAFEQEAIRLAYDPVQIARAMGVGVPLVLRRLATLRSGQGHPDVGLVICDASGNFKQLKPIAGFALPNTGGACPIWPVFSAFSRPDQPVRSIVELPGSTAERFLCYAYATALGGANFDAPPVMQSTMVVLSDPPLSPSDPLPVGVNCAICPRANCGSRREPSVILSS